MTRNVQVLLRNRPGERLADDDVEVVETEIPEIGEGEFLVETKYVSIDFAMRGWLASGRSYVPTLNVGQVVRGCVTGTVVSSRHATFQHGDHVCGMLGVQSHAVSNGAGIYKADVSKAPLQKWAGGLGLTTALTAHLGLLRVGLPEQGETVLVSGASGAVGSLVGQIAKLKGLRVVGVAGGADKCRLVADVLGFDACVDYRQGDLPGAIAAACPDRIDVFFDNVGGPVLDAAIEQLNTYGRVVLCGLTSDRTSGDGPYGVKNLRALLVERASMHGFILFEHEDDYQTAANDIASWYADGHLKLVGGEQVHTGGLGAFSDALNTVLDGQNTGKVILEL